MNLKRDRRNGTRKKMKRAQGNARGMAPSEAHGANRLIRSHGAVGPQELDNRFKAELHCRQTTITREYHR